MNAIAWMAKNPVAANIMMLILIVGGFFSLSTIKQEVFPEFDLDLISIVVPYKGATPSEIDESIILPTNKAIEGIVGIDSIRSNAYEGAGRLTVELEDGSDSAQVHEDIKTAVDNITTFPDGIENPKINMIRRRRDVLSIVIYGDATEQALREIGESAKSAFLSKPSITQVELSGVRAFEISIEITPSQLRRYRLTLQQVSDAIRSSTLDLPGGTIKTSGGEVLIRTKERRYSAAEYARIPIVSSVEGEVLLGDIANVRDSFEEIYTVSTFNGKPSLLVEIYRVGKQTPKAISKAAREAIEEIKLVLPPSVQIGVMIDRSLDLADRIKLLSDNALIGLILVLVLLAMFLEFKLAFWIMMGIPISFFGSLLLIPTMDVSINMISLFAFILVLGLVVDDAIVVGENIYSHQQKGDSKLEASVQGAMEIGAPVLFAILTTVVAFLPFFFVVGTMGKFMRAIPVIVISVLIISYLECMYILPAHLAHSKKTKIAPKKGSFLEWLYFIRMMPNRGMVLVTNGPYRKLLRGALNYRYTTFAIGVFLLLFGAGAIIGGHLKFTFLPRIESDRVIAAVTMPFGTPIHITNKAQEKLIGAAQTLLKQYETEQGHPISIGVFSTLGGLGGWRSRGDHLANVRVYLEPLDIRGFSAREFSFKWRRLVGGIPGAESVTYRFSTGHGGGADINVRFIHKDFDILNRAVVDLKRSLEDYPGVSDIEDSYSDGKPEIQLKLKPEGTSLGMTIQGITQQVRAAFQGLEVLRLQRGSDEVKVILRFPLENRQYRQNLENLIVQTPDGGEVLLSRVALFAPGKSYNQINRIDGKRVVDVTAKVDSKIANTQEITSSLETDVVPNLLADYPALEHSFAARQHRADSLDSLATGGWFALVGIFCLLALQFKSYFQPLVVMTAIPFGVIGAIFGHWILGYQLSLISLLGIMALTGIVVNDSLILVDFVNKSRQKGMPLHNALIEAGTRRFRPIILTSLTTFFGLLPMIFESSLQARFLVPMAISVGFGVMLATFITLLLIPALYLILEDILSPFRKWFSKPPEKEVLEVI